jgi:hypothetical protein
LIGSPSLSPSGRGIASSFFNASTSVMVGCQYIAFFLDGKELSVASGACTLMRFPVNTVLHIPARASLRGTNFRIVLGLLKDVGPALRPVSG